MGGYGDGVGAGFALGRLDDTCQDMQGAMSKVRLVLDELDVLTADEREVLEGSYESIRRTAIGLAALVEFTIAPRLKAGTAP